VGDEYVVDLLDARGFGGLNDAVCQPMLTSNMDWRSKRIKATLVRIAPEYI
jgi:hypothetical protein